MENRANGSWHLRKIIGEVVGVLAADSSIIAELPQGGNGDGPRIREAYLIAAAPQLFEACCKISSVLENNLIVTPEGSKIDCIDIKKSLHDAILRARGCRKAPDEPHSPIPCQKQKSADTPPV